IRSAFVVQCSPCRCAISTAASHIGSGSGVRGGFALRHSSNRWLSRTKSSGIAVFSRDMPHATTQRCIESRTLAESSRKNAIHQRRVEIPGERCLDEAILCDRVAGLRGIPLASLVRELNYRGYQTKLALVSLPDVRSPFL